MIFNITYQKLKSHTQHTAKYDCIKTHFHHKYVRTQSTKKRCFCLNPSSQKTSVWRWWTGVSTAETRWPRFAPFLHDWVQTACWGVKRLKVLPFEPHSPRRGGGKTRALGRCIRHVKWRREGAAFILSYRLFIYRLEEARIYLAESWIIHNHDKERVSKEKQKSSRRQEWNRITIKPGWGTWNKTWCGPTSNPSLSQLFSVQQRHTLLRANLTSTSDADVSNSCRATRL